MASGRLEKVCQTVHLEGRLRKLSRAAGIVLLLASVPLGIDGYSSAEKGDAAATAWISNCQTLKAEHMLPAKLMCKAAIPESIEKPLEIGLSEFYIGGVGGFTLGAVALYAAYRNRSVTGASDHWESNKATNDPGAAQAFELYVSSEIDNLSYIDNDHFVINGHDLGAPKYREPKLN